VQAARSAHGIHWKGGLPGANAARLHIFLPAILILAIIIVDEALSPRTKIKKSCQDSYKAG
jgi:hypothetical protein